VGIRFDCHGEADPAAPVLSPAVRLLGERRKRFIEIERVPRICLRATTQFFGEYLTNAKFLLRFNRGRQVLGKRGCHRVIKRASFVPVASISMPAI